MTLRLTFELTLKSDYHVGAGYGVGGLDSALHRDPDGAPVLRGTTVSGVLREALRELLQLTPLHTPRNMRCQASGKTDTNAAYCGQWDGAIAERCPLCQIFGSPGAPKRWRINSAHPALSPAGDWPAELTGAQAAPHVRVNPRTRRAESGKLFFREEGDGRLHFYFTAVCEATDAETLAEAAWLLAAARAVRHIGASRRRGRGACELHLLEVEGGDVWNQPEAPPQGWEAWLLEHFERLHIQGTPLELATQKIEFAPSTATGTTPVRILLIARLEEPLVLSRKAEAGNEFESIDHIPGATVRGALAGRIAARYDLQAIVPSYATFVELFFKDRVRFSMLYPAQQPSENNTLLYPAIPAPGGLLTCDLYPGFAAHTVADYTHRTAAADYEPECPVCHSFLKPLQGFYSLQSLPQPVSVAHLQEAHVRLHPQTQRAAKGQLYSFDALQPGQYFVGELWCADAAAWEDLQTLAALPAQEPLVMQLGKANRRGYGKVTFWLLPYAGPHPWYQLPLAARVTHTTDLTLTLLTDTIVTDPWGRFRGGFDAAWLTELLGVPVTVQRSFCATRTVETFNNHLGLPRWRDMALCAGSAVGLRIAAPLSESQQTALWEKLAELEENGLGLRRNEGFGRVVFNHPLYQQWAALDNNTTAISLPDVAIAKPVAAAPLELVWEAEFRRKWANLLLQEAQKYTGKHERDPLTGTEFATVARLLRAQPPVSPEALAGLIQQLGHYETLIPVAQQAELKERDAGKAGTEFFRARAGAGLNRLRRLGEQLEDLITECVTEIPTTIQTTFRQRCWRQGMQQVAEYIGAAQQEAK